MQVNIYGKPLCQESKDCAAFLRSKNVDYNLNIIDTIGDICKFKEVYPRIHKLPYFEIINKDGNVESHFPQIHQLKKYLEAQLTISSR